MLILLLLLSPILGLIGMIILLTMAARPSPHHCTACNYPRAGLPTQSLCPECGHSPSHNAAAPRGGLATLRAGEILLLAIVTTLSATIVGATLGILAPDFAPGVILLILPLAAGPGFFLGAVIVRTRRDWLASAAERRP